MHTASRTERVTLSLPAELVARVRAASQGNLSRFVAAALADHLEQERRREIREAMIVAALEKADEDLETAEAFAYVEWEAGNVEGGESEDRSAEALTAALARSK